MRACTFILVISAAAFAQSVSPEFGTLIRVNRVKNTSELTRLPVPQEEQRKLSRYRSCERTRFT